MQDHSETFSVVNEYVTRHLHREKFNWYEQPTERVVGGKPTAFTEANADVHETLWKVMVDFHQLHVEDLNNLDRHLVINLDSAEVMFHNIAQGLFDEGITWGKIVALLWLSGALATKCMLINRPELIKDIVEMTAHFIENPLNDWFTENDGWKGFVIFFQDTHTIDNVSGFNWSKTLGCVVGLLGVLVMGFFFRRKAW